MGKAPRPVVSATLSGRLIVGTVVQTPDDTLECARDAWLRRKSTWDEREIGPSRILGSPRAVNGAHVFKNQRREVVSDQCPLWVLSDRSTTVAQCPLYPPIATKSPRMGSSFLAMVVSRLGACDNRGAGTKSGVPCIATGVPRFGWCHAETSAKCATEMRQVTEADLERDHGDCSIEAL